MRFTRLSEQESNDSEEETALLEQNITTTKQTLLPWTGEDTAPPLFSTTNQCSSPPNKTTVLPEEVVTLIMYFLPVRDILSCARVCRTWRLAAHEGLWRAVFLRDSAVPLAWRGAPGIIDAQTAARNSSRRRAPIGRLFCAPDLRPRASTSSALFGSSGAGLSWRKRVLEMARVRSNWRAGRFRRQAVAAHSDGVHAMAAWRDRLITASEDNTVKVWAGPTPAAAAPVTLSGHSNAVTSLCVHGATLFTGSVDREIRQWRLPGGECERVLSGHQGSVWALLVVPGPEGDLLVSGSVDRSIRVWDAATGRHLRTLQGCEDGLWSLLWLPAPAGALLSGCNAGSLRAWDPRSGEQRCSGPRGFTFKGAVTSLVHTGGSTAAAASLDATIRIVAVSRGGQAIRKLKTLRGHTMGVSDLAADLVTGRLFSTGDDGTLRGWLVRTGDCLFTLTTAPQATSFFSILYDPAGLVCGSNKGELHIWDFAAPSASKGLCNVQ